MLKPMYTGQPTKKIQGKVAAVCGRLHVYTQDLEAIHRTAELRYTMLISSNDFNTSGCSSRIIS